MAKELELPLAAFMISSACDSRCGETAVNKRSSLDSHRRQWNQVHILYRVDISGKEDGETKEMGRERAMKACFNEGEVDYQALCDGFDVAKCRCPCALRDEVKCLRQ